MMKPLAIGAGLAIAAAAGYFAAAGKVPSYSLNVAAPAASTSTTPAKPANTGTVDWIAAAPGRVEPRFGEVRISTAILGQVNEVLVKVNDVVEADELLIRLDDDEARARLAAAEAEAGARKRDRTASPVQPGREDAIKAEDAVFAAERAVTGARYELDYALAAKRKSDGHVTGDDQRLLGSGGDHFAALCVDLEHGACIGCAQAGFFEQGISHGYVGAGSRQCRFYLSGRGKVRFGLDGCIVDAFAGGAILGFG